MDNLSTMITHIAIYVKLLIRSRSRPGIGIRTCISPSNRGATANGKGWYLSQIFGNLGGGIKTRANLFQLNNNTYIHRNL